MLTLLLFLLMAPVTWAQSSPDLDVYVEMFNLKPLPEAPRKDGPLYQLGLRLFYDKQLSGKQNISCGSCHSLGGFSGDTLPLAVGEGSEGLGHSRHQAQGSIIARHTPALYNLGLQTTGSFFWDGRVAKHRQGGWSTPEPLLNGPTPELKEVAETFTSLLAVQAIFPIANPAEMLGQGSSLSNVEAWEETMKRLFNGRLGASYKRFFREAFPGVQEFNIAHVGNALAELERHHFLANKTLWDLYLKGNKSMLTARMKRGAEVFFGKASCVNCHSGDYFTSFGFQNIGIPQIGPGVSGGDDKGLFEVTQNPAHLYRFKIMPLRNIALTAPYMHSGVFKDMREVIEHYNHPMRSLHHFSWNSRLPQYRENLHLDTSRENMRSRTQNLATNLPRMLYLTSSEKDDLYCFLMVALTDIKNQKDLLSKGILDEIDDCSPRLTY